MRMRLTLRAAGPLDAADISRLLHTLGYPSRKDVVHDALGGMFRDPRHAVVVAETDEALVGFLTLAVRPSLSRGGWVGTLEDLVVRSDCRRRGVGQALVQYAKGLAAERGLVRLEVPVSNLHVREAGPFLDALECESSHVHTFCWGALEARHPRVPFASWRLPAVGS